MTMLTLLLLTTLLGSPSGPGARIYVPNQSAATVSIIDGQTHKLIETLDLRKYGMHDNAKPHHIQVEPDGSAWYLTLIGEGKVLKFSRDNKLLASAKMEVPGLIALNPKQDLMYVGRSMSAVNPPQSMAVIRRSDMKLLDEVNLLFPRPHGMVAHPSGQRVYVTSLGTNQIASVGADGNDVKLVDLPGPAYSIVQGAVSSDGKWLAVTGELTGKLAVFDLANPAQPKLVHEISIGAGAFEPVFTGDNRWIFATTRLADQVAVVDTKSWTKVDSIVSPNFVLPHGIGITANGQYILVGSEQEKHAAADTSGAHKGMPGMVMGSGSGPGSLTFVCAATRKVTSVVQVGELAAGLGVAAPKTGKRPAPSACR